MFTDQIMQRLVKKHPAPKFIDRSDVLMHMLIKSIISQQLSVKAASTIYGRVKQLFTTEFPGPDEILQIPDEVFRGAGISYQKISYIQSIAAAFAAGTI